MVLEVLRPPVFKPVTAPLPLRMPFIPVNNELANNDQPLATLDKVPTRMTSSFVPYTHPSINNTATLSQPTTTATSVNTSNNVTVPDSSKTPWKPQGVNLVNSVPKMQPPATRIDRKDTRNLLRPIRERRLVADSDDSSSITSTSLSSSDSGAAHTLQHQFANNANNTEDAAKKSPVVTAAITNVGIREAVVKKKLSGTNSSRPKVTGSTNGSSPDTGSLTEVCNLS